MLILTSFAKLSPGNSPRTRSNLATTRRSRIMQEGKCLCGAVSWQATGPENWAGFCHCESCRRNCASPVTAFFGVPNGSWRWTGETPNTYQHTEHATRYFCAKCGTPMAYFSARWPDEIHFYAAALTDPESFKPNEHFHYGERLSWLNLTDDLPKHNSSADPNQAT